ncbi:MAG: hypothetical protein OK441_05755, partial [Thaumarchaeota archaeon]|nr:hypothetical protein [Nitrososphaerota archaeon]
MARTTRRAFLKTLAGGVAVTATGYVALGELHYLPGWAFPWNSHPQSFTVSVVRPDDFVYLDFEFVNLYLSATANSANLVKFASPAYIIVTFPPQSVAEQAFYEVPASNYSQQDGNGNPLTSGEPGYEPNPSSGETPTSRPVDSVIAGTSRVVFVVPSSVDTIKYTLDSLLSAISTYDMNVVPVALPPPTSLIVLNQKTTTSTSQPSISAPDVDETAIEVPFRLIVSPHQYERWAHATDPVTHGVSTELWHSRLASGLITDGVLDETVPSYMRAVWSPDFASLSSLPPHYSPNTSYTLPGTTPFVEFRSGLDARDRSEIVHLSSDFGIAHYEPATVTVNRLMLSSLGAWLSADAAWSPPSPLEVEAWNHVSTMARDHYVRVVYAGYLFPFGHSASLVKITERRFDPAPESNSVSSQTAYLRQRMFIVVREPVVGYPSPGMQHSGRKFPFTSLKVTTTVTPDLDDPTQSEAYSGQGQDAFWPRVSGQDFRFHCVGTDSDGQRSEFTVPMIFIGDSIAVPQDGTHQGILNSIIQKYGSSGPERVEPDMAGQRVALAQSHTAGDTSFETQFADLEAEPKDPNAPVPPSDQPQFYPAFADAGLRIPAVAQLTPNATPPQGQSQVLATTTVSFPDLYLANGFNSSNVGEVFAQIAASDQIPLDFSQDANNSGGIVTPSLNIVGLSRMSGLLGGLPNLNDADLASYINQLGAGTFDPSSFFNQVDAKILGGIPLTDILNAGTVGQGPKMVSHVIYQNNDPTMQPIAFETNISWDASALLKADPTGTFEPSHSSLTLQAVIHTDLTANPTTTFQITSTLTNFAV